MKVQTLPCLFFGLSKGGFFILSLHEMKFLIPAPKNGDKRTIKRFAWLPVEIIEGNECFVVWMEFYYISQEFCEGQEYRTRQWKEIERSVRK